MIRYFLVLISSNLVNHVPRCKQKQRSGWDGLFRPPKRRDGINQWGTTQCTIINIFVQYSLMCNIFLVLQITNYTSLDSAIIPTWFTNPFHSLKERMRLLSPSAQMPQMDCCYFLPTTREMEISYNWELSKGNWNLDLIQVTEWFSFKAKKMSIRAKKSQQSSRKYFLLLRRWILEVGHSGCSWFLNCHLLNTDRNY